MRVGQYLLVESGLNKNACLVYSCPQLSQGLSIAIDCSARVSHLNLDNLKQKAQESSIFHVGAWESDFDAKILVLSGAPSKKPSLLSSKDTSTLPRNKFEKFVAQHALEVDGARSPMAFSGLEVMTRILKYQHLYRLGDLPTDMGKDGGENIHGKTLSHIKCTPPG